tara:strand:+ start:114 stop:272 length:159 start_codon:yes stop_codon:yes gene_type:complete
MTYTVSYFIWENKNIKHKKAIIKLKEGEKIYNHLKKLHGEDLINIRKVLDIK